MYLYCRNRKTRYSLSLFSIIRLCRRDGRAVQGVALELLCRLLFTEGSNPPLIPSHPQGGAAQAAQEAPTPQPQVEGVPGAASRSGTSGPSCSDVKERCKTFLKQWGKGPIRQSQIKNLQQDLKLDRSSPKDREKILSIMVTRRFFIETKRC